MFRKTNCYQSNGFSLDLETKKIGYILNRLNFFVTKSCVAVSCTARPYKSKLPITPSTGGTRSVDEFQHDEAVKKGLMGVVVPRTDR